jgi:hypothetical protein
MQKPGVHIETIHNPRRYTYAQIDRGMRDRAEARPRQAGPRRTAQVMSDLDQLGVELRALLASRPRAAVARSCC